MEDAAASKPAEPVLWPGDKCQCVETTPATLMWRVEQARGLHETQGSVSVSPELNEGRAK